MKKSLHKLSRTQLGEAMALYVAGSTVTEIAQRYNVSGDTVRRALRDLGVYKTDEHHRRSHAGATEWSNEEYAAAVALRDLGHSASIIGDIIGRSDSAVRRKLSEDKPEIEEPAAADYDFCVSVHCPKDAELQVSRSGADYVFSFIRRGSKEHK